MDVLLDNSAFRGPDGSSLPVAAMPLVCNAGNAVIDLLTLSPHQQLQQRLLSLLEAIQPSDRIDASALLPVIDAYEALVQHELDTGLRALPHTLDGPPIPDSTFYETCELGNKDIHLLGETHGFPTSIGHLRTIIKSLDGIPAKDILFLLERTSTGSFSDCMRHFLQHDAPLHHITSLTLAHYFCIQLRMPLSFSVVSGNTKSALHLLYEQLYQIDSRISFLHLVAFYISANIRFSAQQQRIVFNNFAIPTTFSDLFLATYADLLCIDINSLKDAYYHGQLPQDCFKTMNDLLTINFPSICDAQTTAAVQQAIQNNTHVKHIVCIAGANHIPSVRKGLGVPSTTV